MESENIVLDLKNVSRSFSGRNVLKNISWTIKRKEYWALIGANGSGKTTLLRIACGYLWYTVGEVYVLGRRLGGVDVRELRKKIGWVSSALHDRTPLSETALNVVISGKYASIGLWSKPSKSEVKRAEELIEFFNCSEVKNNPFGILSQGEQQKILIARALMPKPELLILDEPCSGLDLTARENFLQSIQKLAVTDNGPTIIYVTHHIEEIVPEFSRVLVLREGCVHASGLKKEVLTSEVLSKAFKIKLNVEERDGRYYVQYNA